MPRYQPLSMDTDSNMQHPATGVPVPTTPFLGSNTGPGGPALNIHRPNSSRRSPFYCGDACFTLKNMCLHSTSMLDLVRRQAIGYTAGALFAIGWWLFIDGIAFNGSKAGSIPVVQVGFEDWAPGIISTVALIIVNLIDRETLNADDFEYSGPSVACKARACAFLGVTMALGSLGGALAVLSLKFIIPNVSGDAFYLGQAITIQNFLIFFSSMILWFGRNHQDEGTIAL
ncbi:hypothetical protein BATDEDRAFT_26562 [Batrachochytrium dendrobatidis JAM81]|uniref:Uncharacterized protein n=2 Tax=Batrachochytrium dendrobatidis TaxID=109871 RepID=F4P8J1_BATDJ|nr:uncharacterized protein BATDEDRAFT_26562 [Batrachochytrium dendrobatidis JAM81]EGF78680.1 hypothetical protein BATDEDRAFT_26562 [Batrachochytrium dendrobatidis JAM81]KAJ8324035.1 Vacuolar protein sorting-associated protein 68 [Batrachochytrium dendrobatidis]KAK5664837.1 Vacuolar protein sorting-associated protein 68 [Batrachochytrium dendrobatidis]OAJ43582.1 hypothetical protein BDEG_26927 [Batrachochytrium dendrobatidis JEL423]|eukprot:XP_006680701.1 hypothetical protein BATDEDRAFT_26562 [Batrachochytrium dendrobatidis JAM81]